MISIKNTSCCGLSVVCDIEKVAPADVVYMMVKMFIRTGNKAFYLITYKDPKHFYEVSQNIKELGMGELTLGDDTGDVRIAIFTINREVMYKYFFEKFYPLAVGDTVKLYGSYNYVVLDIDYDKGTVKCDRGNNSNTSYLLWDFEEIKSIINS